MSKPPDKDLPPRHGISEEDILRAMKDIPGYLDVTPADLRELYAIAFSHALERIRTSVRAADIMSRGVVSVRTDTPLAGVAAVMAARGISGVPVLDAKGAVAGVISEKDFLRKMGGGEKASFMAVIAECLGGKGCLAAPARAKTAADIMTSPAVLVAEDATIAAIAALMTDKGINRVPVVDAGGRMVGLVSRTDIVRASLVMTGTP